MKFSNQNIQEYSYVDLKLHTIRCSIQHAKKLENILINSAHNHTKLPISEIYKNFKICIESKNKILTTRSFLDHENEHDFIVKIAITLEIKNELNNTSFETILEMCNSTNYIPICIEFTGDESKENCELLNFKINNWLSEIKNNKFVYNKLWWISYIILSLICYLILFQNIKNFSIVIIIFSIIGIITSSVLLGPYIFPNIQIYDNKTMEFYKQKLNILNTWVSICFLGIILPFIINKIS